MGALRQGPRDQACLRLDAEVGARLRAPAMDVSWPDRQGAAVQEHLVGAWKPPPSPAPVQAPPVTPGRLQPRHHGYTCTQGPAYVLTGLGVLGHDLERVINFSDFPFSQM